SRYLCNPMEPTEINSPRERLLDAAGEVFAERGFDGATIREITRQAGVNLAAVNYYFRDKDELYAATLRHAHTAACSLPYDDEATMTPEQRLYVFVENLLRRFLDPLRPRWHGQLMAREMAQPTRIFDQVIAEAFRPKCEWLRRALTELCGGRFQGVELDYVATSIIGQCTFYRQNRHIIQQIFPGLLAADDLIERLARHITEFSLAAIRHMDTGPSSTTNEHLVKNR
ncbi:MAG: CerR family C-terminal domain-containing protein, partial [Chthoniobacterales bacterium]